MKKSFKIYFLFFSLLIFAHEIHGQKQNKDYISSQYYQKIAEAELFYLEGKEKESYQILLELDSQSYLLNGAITNELYYFLELSLKNNNYEDAYKSMYKLITNYGYKLEDFSYLHNFNKMKKKSDWNILKKELITLEYLFISNSIIHNEIKTMLNDDQYYREDGYKRIKEFMEKDTTDPYHQNVSLFRFSSYMAKVDSIDNQNFNRLFKIIDSYGFPLSSSLKYTPRERQEVYVGLFVMLVHFSDSTRIDQLKPLLLENIRNGNCPPELLATLVDTYQSRNKEFSIYGTYGKISPEDLSNSEKLNLRRQKIGLPSYETSKK